MARVGSACFLFVQMLMLLDFVTNWNDSWVDKEDERQGIPVAPTCDDLTSQLTFWHKPTLLLVYQAKFQAPRLLHLGKSGTSGVLT